MLLTWPQAAHSKPTGPFASRRRRASRRGTGRRGGPRSRRACRPLTRAHYARRRPGTERIRISFVMRKSAKRAGSPAVVRAAMNQYRGTRPVPSSTTQHGTPRLGSRHGEQVVEMDSMSRTMHARSPWESGRRIGSQPVKTSSENRRMLGPRSGHGRPFPKINQEVEKTMTRFGTFAALSMTLAALLASPARADDAMTVNKGSVTPGDGQSVTFKGKPPAAWPAIRSRWASRCRPPR